MKKIGNYRVVKELALDDKGQPQGGFGRIYQAEHIYLDELACIKTNKPERDPELNRQHIEMLWAETKLLWKLNEHHSIPSSKDFLKVDAHTAAMVMNYIQGETLAQMIEKQSQLHPEDACWIAERLLDALHYCHCNAVVHSDIKPENLFVESAKRDIKLIDFGLAAYMPTAKTVPLGYTPKYAAPELLQGKPPLPETDIYGAGIIMLYALGGNVESKSFPKDAPSKLVKYCERFLRYDPTERPNWKKENILTSWSDIRFEVFGRRHIR